MQLRAKGITDVGLVREHNEDALLVDEALGLFIAADGVGGYAAGEVASRMVCQIVHEHVQGERAVLERAAATSDKPGRTAVVALLKRAVHAACEAVYESGQRDPARRGMASTVVIAQVIGAHAMIVHVGDSRAYIVRQGRLHRLTDDHSLLGEMVRRGEITPEDAARSSLCNVVTRAVGFQPFVEVDALHVELMSGDRLLLCTDGLHGKVADGDIAEAFATHDEAAVPRALLDAAYRGGGSDNITAVVVEIAHAVPADAVAPTRKLEALRSIRLFEHLTYKELNAVVALATVQTFKPGQRIILEGDEGDSLYVSVVGRVEVVKQGPAIATLPAGSSFGEMALIDRRPRSADVVAGDLVRTLVIARDELFALMRGEPELAAKLLWAFCRALNARLRETSAELSWLKNTGQDTDDGLPAIMED